MTVESATASASYTGNGVTAIFPIPFYFLVDTDLKVTRKSAATGVISTLALNSDYTLTGAGNSAGGSLTSIPALPNFDEIYIERNVVAVQETAYPNNGPFPAASHERALDRLTMLIQQILTKLTFGLFRDPLTGVYDADGSRITNLADGVADSDAASLGQVTQAVAAAQINPSIPPSDVVLYSTLGASSGSSKVGFLAAGVNAVLRTLQSKARDTVSLLDYGGKDDNGVTDNAVPFSNAKAALGGTGRVQLPYTSTGTYYFSVAPDTAGVTLDPDEGVVLSGAFPLGSTVKTRRDVKVHVTAQNFDYRLTDQFQKAWADRTLFLTDGDIDRGTMTSVATASLFHEKQVWVSDTWAAATGEYSLGSDSVTWNTLAADTYARVSSCTIKPGEELMVAFPTTGGYRRIAVIRTTTAIYYVTADGANAAPLFGNKPVGGSSAYNTFTYNGRSSHASYYPENCVWSIKVYDRNHFGVFFNGVEVTNIQATSGDIVRAGFGVQSLSGSLTASVVGWAKFVNKPLGGKQGINILCIGDSLTADIHGGWPYAIREALDLSFGIRVNNVTNQAISGDNVNHQLSVLQASGTGSASHAFICLGTNDIQFATDTASFLSDLGTMIDTLTAAFCTPIVWIPPLWYLQANGTGGGQPTQNYEIGAEKRARIARLCADKGVKCVDMMQVSGAVLGTYLTAGNGLDPVVRDNIHPTTYFYRQIAFRLARALAGAYSLPSTKYKANTAFPSSALQNGWTNGGGASYAVDSDGFVTLSGYVSPGTLTDGTTVLQLPEHLYPAATGRFLVSKGGASVALAQLGTNGALAIYGGASASYLALDGIVYQGA